MRWLQAHGAEHITVGDRSGMGNTRAVMEAKGIFRLAEELGFDTVVLDELDAAGVAVLRHLGTTRRVSRGPIFRLAQIARAVELDLGVHSPGQIELVSADAHSEECAAQIRAILARG